MSVYSRDNINYKFDTNAFQNAVNNQYKAALAEGEARSNMIGQTGKALGGLVNEVGNASYRDKIDKAWNSKQEDIKKEYQRIMTKHNNGESLSGYEEDFLKSYYMGGI